MDVHYTAVPGHAHPAFDPGRTACPDPPDHPSNDPSAASSGQHLVPDRIGPSRRHDPERGLSRRVVPMSLVFPLANPSLVRP